MLSQPIRFYIGIRADEIVSIGPTTSEKLPTAYHLRSGHSISSTGEWQANTRAVERLLNEDIETPEQLRLERVALDAAISLLRKERLQLSAVLRELAKARGLK